MSNKIAAENQYYAIEFDDELGAVVFTWKEYASGEEFRASLGQLHDEIVEAGTEKYLVDTRAITAHEDADKQWIADTWIPRLIDSGVRYGASIYPDSVVADMDMEGIEDSVNQIDERFTFRAFSSMTETRDWLSRQ